MNFKKVLLINPNPPRNVRFKKYAHAIPSIVPLSLGYLAGYLHSKDIEAEIHDEQLGQIDEDILRSYIIEKGFGVVGISSTTMYIKRTMFIAETVKKISKDVKVILGGVHPTVMPDDCLKNENIDLVVRQEGEITLHELIKSFHGEMELENINGISYRKNGDVVHNSKRDMIKDLDSLPPFPYHMFAVHKDRYRFQVLSSRGCPYKCVFCSARSITGHQHRRHGAERVVKEIEYLANELGIDRIAFADDTFTAIKKKVREICDLIIQKGLNKKVSFFCAARGDTVNREILEKMKEAGFRGLYFGIETATDRLMEIINKGETVEDNVRAVKLANELGLKTRGTFIIGLPTETVEDSMKTIDLAVNLPLDFASFSLATPYPSTELFEIAKKEGFESTDFANFDIAGGITNKPIPYVPKGRTSEELVSLQKKAYFRFYMKPKRIISYLKGEGPDLNLKNLNWFDRVFLSLKVFVGQFGK